MGAALETARGLRLRGRSRRCRLRLLRDARNRAPLRRPRACAEEGARRCRSGVGCAHRRCGAEVRGACCGARCALRTDPDRLRPQDARFPRTAAADPAPVDSERREELEELGVRRLGQLAGLPGAAVAERLGPYGRRAWSLARGEQRGKVRARKVANELAETLEFPEAVANELTLRRAL